jgi:hypothetical protein
MEQAKTIDKLFFNESTINTYAIPWEELIFNKDKDLAYEKDLKFHILDYSKPLQFVSAHIYC